MSGQYSEFEVSLMKTEFRHLGESNLLSKREMEIRSLVLKFHSKQSGML